METEFVSELQLGSVTRAGQLPRQEGRFWWEDPFLAVVGRVGAELWSTGCSARLVGLCESNSFFSVFKMALVCLLLCSDGDGLPGAEVAHREDSSSGISGTFLTVLQPSALPAGWAGTTCGERSRAGCS